MTESPPGGGERIRVLHVITRLAARGAPRHVLDLAERLDNERFDVSILTGTPEADEGDLLAEARSRGLRIHVVSEMRRSVRPLRDLISLYKAYRFIRSGRFDVVHTHISKAGILGRVAAWLARTPVIVHTYHGAAGELAGVGLRPRVLRACERLCAAMSDGCIAISHHVAEQFEEMGIIRAHDAVVINNGVSLENFHPASFPKPVTLKPGPVIGTVGSLTHEKGTSDLLDAAAVLCSSRPDLTVCIVGGGPLRNMLEARAQQLGIARQVIFTGVVEDVRPWISAFDVFVLPSRSEGMGLSLIEAMALGCPVVATKVGGIPEAVGDTGVLVQADRPDELANEIARLLSDDELRQQLSQSGVERSRVFSLAIMANKTGELYEQLLTQEMVARERT